VGETRIGQKEYETLAEVRYALRKLLRFSELTALANGATPQQYQALQAIKGFPSRSAVTIGELAERLQLQHHSTVGLVNRLVSQGLVQREHSTTDRRQMHVVLTAKGELLLEQLTVAHLAEWRRIAPSLSQLLLQIAEDE